MMFICQLIQAFFIYKFKNRICFLCLSYDRTDRSILTSIELIGIGFDLNKKEEIGEEHES